MKECYAVYHLGETEVGDLDDRGLVICKQDIVGFQITVSNAHVMNVLKVSRQQKA